MGNEQKQYALLWRYASEMMKSDPHSTIRIKPRHHEGKKLFSRIYICWGSLKQGFMDGCRQIICLDGCHIKAKYSGILLTAVGLDGNNGLYPVAYAVVEKEKKETWEWFLEYLKSDLNIADDTSSWTFMSDKQKGLINAVSDLFPNCHHKFCVYHMYTNFKQNHKGLALKKILWKAARCTRVCDFEDVLNELAKKDPKAFAWLIKNPAVGWSRAYFTPGAKSDMLLNNHSESFNKMILCSRSKPIIEMLESIRMILMTRVYRNRDKMKSWHANFCPKIHKKLEKLKKMACALKCEWNGEHQFQISDSNEGIFKIDVVDMTCTCRRWQLTGYPCAHAIAAFTYMGCNVEDYVDECYRTSTYLRVYSHCMYMLNGVKEWPLSDQPDLLPPMIENLPGRPKKHARRKSNLEKVEENAKKAMEKANEAGKLGRNGIIMNCRFCKLPGHNIRTCDLYKKHLAEQGKGSSNGRASTVIVQNTRAGITEAMNTLNQDNYGQMMASPTQEACVVATSRLDKLATRGGGKKKQSHVEESSVGAVDGVTKKKKLWRP